MVTLNDKKKDTLFIY